MILNIAKREYGEIKQGVYYFRLSNYPHIGKSELRGIIEFINYEKLYNRQTKIVCENKEILAIIKDAVAKPEAVETILNDIEFYYHATNINATRKILSGGKLLSAVKVYGKSGETLAYEKRESPWCDPADFFEYIMLCNGDDMTGDYVVLSENFPSEDDLAKGNYNPGIRFYFRSSDIIKHPGHVFDGYHPIKIKDEILLSEYLFACIVPEQFKIELVDCILPELASKVFYLSQDGLGLSEWNDKVYNFVKKF